MADKLAKANLLPDDEFDSLLLSDDEFDQLDSAAPVSTGPAAGDEITDEKAIEMLRAEGFQGDPTKSLLYKPGMLARAYKGVLSGLNLDPNRRDGLGGFSNAVGQTAFETAAGLGQAAVEGSSRALNVADRAVNSVSNFASRAVGSGRQEPDPEPVGKDFIALMEAMLRLQKKGYEKNRKGGGKPELAGAILGGMAAPGGPAMGRAKGVVDVLKNVGKAAAEGAGWGSVAPDYEADISNPEDAYGKRAAGRAGVGGVVGGGIAGSTNIIGSAAGKAMNKSANAKTGTTGPTIRDDVQAVADRHNVPTKWSMLDPNSSLARYADNTSRNAEIREAFTAAVERSVDDLFVETTKNTKYPDLTRIRALANKPQNPNVPVDRRVAAAKAVMAAVDEGDKSGDWMQLMRTSGAVNILKAKLKADDFFDKARSVGRGAKADQTVYTATLGGLKDKFGRVSATDLKTSPVQKLLSSLEVAVGEKSGKPLTAADLIDIRQDIAREAKRFAVSDELNDGIVTQLRRSIDDDIRRASPETQRRLAKADEVYEKLSRYKEGAAAELIVDPSKTNVDVFNYGASSDINGKEVAQDVYSKLGAKGKKAYMLGLAKTAMAASKTEFGLDPNKFLAYLEAKNSAFEVFKGTDKYDIQGLRKLAEHLQYVTARPETEAVSGEFRRAGGAASPGAIRSALLFIMSTEAMDRMVNSPKAVKWLTAASDTPPGSKAMNDVISNLEAELRKSAVINTTRK